MGVFLFLIVILLMNLIGIVDMPIFRGGPFTFGWEVDHRRSGADSFPYRFWGGLNDAAFALRIC